MTPTAYIILYQLSYQHLFQNMHRSSENKIFANQIWEPHRQNISKNREKAQDFPEWRDFGHQFKEFSSLDGVQCRVGTRSFNRLGFFAHLVKLSCAFLYYYVYITIVKSLYRIFEFDLVLYYTFMVIQFKLLYSRWFFIVKVCLASCNVFFIQIWITKEKSLIR